MRKALLTICLMGAATTALQAQDSKWGSLTGSFETNTSYYLKDKDISFNPDDKWGSNNYLKVDYSNFGGKLTAGLQVEGYLPALQGYEFMNEGRKAFLGGKYISWQDEYYGIRVGDIFDQFGSGLVFRSYEDRALGINNSIEGAQARLQYKDYVKFKGMYGRPRLYLDYLDSKVAGADLEVGLSSLLGMQNAYLYAAGSYVNRHEDLKGANGYKNDVNMYSARVGLDWNGFTANVEYVGKSKDYTESFTNKSGNAILAEMGYTYKRFTALGTFRRLKHMNTKLSLAEEGMANVLNYLPALTRQYTYSLANLDPYQVQADGEIGGQIDLYYSIRNKKNRSNYWNFHANASMFYSDKKITGKSRLLWRDISADVEHQWNKQWKTTVLVSVQEKSQSHGMDDYTYASNIFVVDNTYKLSKKNSIRLELQYLYSENNLDNERDWMAALVEFSMAPHWSFSVSDMYNHGGEDKLHYYNASVSYSYKKIRAQVGYGRNRAGYVCSGGVCRYTPAYTGANLSLTASF